MFHNIFMIIRKDIIKSPLFKPKIKSSKKKEKIKENDDIDIFFLLN